MNAIETYEAFCPYCGEPIALVVDHCAGEQTYYEDCQVCCQPILCRISMDEEGRPNLSLSSDNDG